jgi:NADH-quinone oxidoreductase subunit H
MMSLAQTLEIWKSGIGLPTGTPLWVVAAIGIFLIYVLVIFPSGAIVSLVDRKLSADFQARVGPNRAGPAGILQPLADLLKFLQKEPSREWNWQETLWLGIHTMALYSTVAVLPLGSAAILVNTDMSAFLPFWSALVLALGTMLMGFSQGTVSGWFGGVRLAAQALAGAFPALICVLCAGIRAGSFRWAAFASVQGASPLHWTATTNPFQFIAMIVFIAAGLVMMNVPPMDGGLSETDLHGGVSSDLSGRRLSLFRLGRFYGFFFWCQITVVLFLGAWTLPNWLIERISDGSEHVLREVIELLWLLFKTYALMIVLIWIARVNPRARVDQTTDFSWKVLSPFSLGALIGAALWAGWRAML